MLGTELAFNNLYRPPLGFYFRVMIEDYPKSGAAGGLAGAAKGAFNKMQAFRESSFMEVSGINVSVDTEDVKVGGENTVQYKLPTGLKYEPLVLKRGLWVDSNLIAWVEKSLHNFEFKKKKVTVKLLGVSDAMMLVGAAGGANLAQSVGAGIASVVAAWEFVEAYPAGYTLDPLKSTENQLAIETITLNYKEFRALTM